VHLKYGFRSGAFAYLTLTRETPSFDATLRLGRTQSSDSRQAFDLLPYDVAEIELASRRVQVGSLPAFARLGVAAGWFREHTTGVSTTRLDARLAVESARIPVAPRLSAGAQAGLRLSQYGTGQSRTIASFGADLTYGLDARTWVTLAYTYANIRGPQPLLIDNVEPASTISLTATRVIPEQYRVSVGVAHNTALNETKYYTSAAFVVRRNLELGISAIYNSRLSAFEDIDYTARVICDCVDVTLRYRQMRGEFSFQVGLLGFGPDRALLPRAPRPAPTLPPDPVSPRSP
jgi:hypothetical protein